MDTTDDLITVARAAEMLACNPMTVRRMMQRGRLGEIVRAGRKFVRIRKSAVEAFILEATK